jgi:hypothetical protein
MMQGQDNTDEDDILPDTKVDRERTLTGKWALFVLVSSAIDGHKHSKLQKCKVLSSNLTFT